MFIYFYFCRNSFHKLKFICFFIYTFVYILLYIQIYFKDVF